MGKKLAIKGHPTRGNEVIELFKMMGGWECGYCGCGTGFYYYISQFGNIEASCKPTDFDTYIVYTLEEFWEKYPLKVGDKVKDLKSDKTAEVYKIHWSENNSCVYYDIKYPNNCGCQRKLMDLQPYKEEPNMKESTILNISAIDYNNRLVGYEIPEGYEFDTVIDNKVVLKKLKSTYPKTYDECCKNVLGMVHCGMTVDVPMHYSPLILNFTELLICRDAYWKIAGEEMGLDGPWKPDWKNYNEYKYCLYITENNVNKGIFYNDNHILAFPSEEMRDVFCENFKKEIEQYKELL